MERARLSVRAGNNRAAFLFGCCKTARIRAWACYNGRRGRAGRPRTDLLRLRANTMHRPPSHLVFVAILAAAAVAQRPPEQLDSAALLHRIEKLGVCGSVLYVAAHPDDENTRLISLFSSGLRLRTAYLSLTRGDGGQNLIGSQLGDGLGVLRTQELLEARRIDGGEQYFSRAVDFGYSKTPEETFAKWGREGILADVVRVIREFRPDVIVTRFATDGSGGHGHHTASAMLAQEAFEQAADPNAFPEQIAHGLAPWQPRRLFFNASTWWNPDLAKVAEQDPSRWVRLDVGGYDALLGASFTEIAGRSRSQHKSQGFGAAETRGSLIEYLRLERGAPLVSDDPFEGIDLTWNRVNGAQGIARQLADLTASFDLRHPDASAGALTDLAAAIERLAGAAPSEKSWLLPQAERARELALQACGVVLEFTAETPTVAAGGKLAVEFSALQRQGDTQFTLLDLSGPALPVRSVEQIVPSNQALRLELALELPRSAPIDQPYWLAADPAALAADGAARLGTRAVAPVTARFSVRLRDAKGHEFALQRALLQRWVDRVDGERSRIVAVTPVASIEPADNVLIVRGDHATVQATLEALIEPLAGEWSVDLPSGWSLEQSPGPLVDLRKFERRSVEWRLRRAPDAGVGSLGLRFAGSAGASALSRHQLDHPHVLPQTWYTPAQVRLVPLEVDVDVRHVGYIDGAGDEVPRALVQLGVEVERIDPASVNAAELDRFDSIVTGIRAYNTQEQLARLQPALLAYVERGGTLVVQYNTVGADLRLPAEKIGPYPFNLTRQRVTVEEAAPTFLAPEHAVMHSPNRLNAADFEGWVQERGLYFAGGFSDPYVALIAWNDPGENPTNGAWITCDHGQGRFHYVGLSLFRQLPAGVPGAYRVLANLIARRKGRG